MGTRFAVGDVACGQQGNSEQGEIMTRTQLGSTILTIVAAGALVVSSAAAAKGAASGAYHPKIDPASFTDRITNRYFSVIPGTVHQYVGKRDGVPTAHTFTVTRQTRTVMGVRCVVVKDVVTQNGSLVEKTTDWYAQDKAGNVWYFGEDTAEYQNGVVTSTAGTWEAGVDKAQPGIVMPAHPKVGVTYRQEYRPGVALDMATILSLRATVTVPAGTFRNVIVTFDKNPLDPSKKERKWYAPGGGFVKAILHGGGHVETTLQVK
jgi:hypothetical protein